MKPVANLSAFADTLLELAKTDRNILVVTSDSRGSGKLIEFARQLPDQIVEVGIAEQNLVGVAAGLASCGKTVFAVSPASFLTARALEQIKNDVAYSDNRVNLIGISAGVSYGALGSTHHSLHDFAVLRAVHNLDITAPADNFETRQTIKAALSHPRPLYIRFGKNIMPHLHQPSDTFMIGRANLLRTGRDIALIASGETAAPALKAAERLSSQNLSTRVISMHTLKPLDTQTLLTAARECRAILTLEEHSLYGGLGEACAAVLMQAGIRMPFRILGIPDEDTVTGSQADIFRHYGLDVSSIAMAAQQIIKTK